MDDKEYVSIHKTKRDKEDQMKLERRLWIRFTFAYSVCLSLWSLDESDRPRCCRGMTSLDLSPIIL